MGYIFDFYCAPLKLAIEVDGSSHDARTEQDFTRQKEIEKLGIHFLRFTEKDVRNNVDSVLREIKMFIKERGKTTPALADPACADLPVRGTQAGAASAGRSGTPLSKGDNNPPRHPLY